MTRTITTITDGIVSEKSPSTNYHKRPTLMVRGVSGSRMFAYITVTGLSIRPGAIVHSATLRLYPTTGRPSMTYRLRRNAGAWTASGLRWNNMPGGNLVRDFTTTTTTGQPLNIDVTDVLTAWLTNGVANHGFRLETLSTASTGSSFHSSFATGTNARFRPALILDVSYPPDAPTAIAPASGTVSLPNPKVTWRYGGEGSEKMVAYQIQSNTNNTWSLPSFDSGEIASTEPEHRLEGVTSDGLWFRIRHKAADGRWSPWSAATRIFYAARPIVTITSDEAVTDDPTPSTTWTVTGTTQTAFRVLIRLADHSKILADSGIVSGDDQQWEPASPIAVDPAVEMTRTVRIWDDVDRVATAGAPAYTSAVSAPFRIEPATSVVPVSNLAVSNPIGPAVDVTWTRPTTPDSYIIERRIAGGPWRQIAHPESGEVALGGTSYRWRDVTAPAEHELTYRVRSRLNRGMSEAPLERSITVRHSLIWLADPDDPEWLLAMADRDEGSWAMGEDSSTFEVVGSDRVNIVHEGYRGYEGSISGLLVSDVPSMGGTSAQDQRDQVWDIKRKPVHVWRLAIGDMNIPVILRDVTAVPRPGGELSFGVSASFYQQGELPWEE